MEIAVKGILAVFWLVLVPIAVGRLPFIKRRQPLLLERFLVGYLILFSLMEILSLPMIFLKMPLHYTPVRRVWQSIPKNFTKAVEARPVFRYNREKSSPVRRLDHDQREHLLPG